MKSAIYSPIKVALAGSVGGGFAHLNPEIAKKIEVEFFSIRNNPRYPNLEIKNSKAISLQRRKSKNTDLKNFKRKFMKVKWAEKRKSIASNNESKFDPICK